MKPGFLAALKSRQLACALLAQPAHPLAHPCHPSAPRTGLSRPRCLSCSRARGEGKGSVCICVAIKCAKWEQNETVAYPKMTRESLFVAKWETCSHVDWAAPPGCAGKSLPELSLMSQACRCVLGALEAVTPDLTNFSIARSTGHVGPFIFHSVLHLRVLCKFCRAPFRLLSQITLI